VFELYTESPTRSLLLSAGDHGVAPDRANVTIDPSQSDVCDFDVLPNLRRFVNGDPVESFARMARADVLVISKSSFSYLAGLINKSSIVVYHPFEHPCLPGWLLADASGHLDQRKLKRQLDRLQAARSFTVS
jgi:hypothetical protein